MRNIAQRRQGQVSFARRRCPCGSRSHRRSVRERPGIGISAAVLSSVARGKGRCSCDGRLFHSARMLVLVTSQSSATCKGLLAICEGAFVWSFARVYATMSGQRARIAERLPNLSALTTLMLRKTLTLPQRSHMCGFSPEWTRMCTVRADRCMKGLLQPCSGQTCGLSPLCIRSIFPCQQAY